MNSNKSILKRIYIGVYEGYKIQIVPSFIINLEKKLYFRLFKLVGGFSTIFIITGIANNYNKIIFYIAVIPSLLYLFYRIFYTYYVTIEVFKIIKDKRYQVRNSPLDHLSTIFKGVFIAAKTTGKFSVGAGIGYSLANELDSILAEEGRERVFVPAIKAGLDKIGATDGVVTVMERLGLTKTKTVDQSVITQAAQEIEVTTSELEEAVQLIKERRSISNDESKTILKNIKESK